jgi:hypothetical protein
MTMPQVGSSDPQALSGPFASRPINLAFVDVESKGLLAKPRSTSQTLDAMASRHRSTNHNTLISRRRDYLKVFSIANVTLVTEFSSRTGAAMSEPGRVRLRVTVSTGEPPDECNQALN